jgi:hypothetical protein
MKGFTENYVPVYFSAPATLENQLVTVEIERVEGSNVFGKMV